MLSCFASIPNAAISSFETTTGDCLYRRSAYGKDRSRHFINHCDANLAAKLAQISDQRLAIWLNAAWGPLDMARFCSALLFLGTVTMTGGAEASSLVFLPASDGSSGPSVVVVGEAVPASSETASGSGGGSVAAVGEAPPPVSHETLSSIAGDAPSPPGTAPLMIRGGIVGDMPQKQAAPSAEPPTADKTPEPSPPGLDIGASEGSGIGPH